MQQISLNVTHSAFNNDSFVAAVKLGGFAVFLSQCDS